MNRYVAFLAVGALAASSAIADVKLLNSGYSGQNITHPIDGLVFAGAVKLQATNGQQIGAYTSGQSWRTFCIEADETVVWGGTYKASVEPYAWQGGYTGGPNDPVSSQTAWLYSKFLNGTLASYGAGYADNNAGNSALQMAIWYLEGEWVDPSLNPVALSGTAAALVTLANNNAQNGKFYGIQAVNLYTQNSPVHPYQSFLVAVPAPGAALLVALGLSLVGWLKRQIA